MTKITRLLHVGRIDIDKIVGAGLGDVGEGGVGQVAGGASRAIPSPARRSSRIRLRSRELLPVPVWPTTYRCRRRSSGSSMTGTRVDARGRRCKTDDRAFSWAEWSRSAVRTAGWEVVRAAPCFPAKVRWGYMASNRLCVMTGLPNPPLTAGSFPIVLWNRTVSFRLCGYFWGWHLGVSFRGVFRCGRMMRIKMLSSIPPLAPIKSSVIYVAYCDVWRAQSDWHKNVCI